MFDLQEFLQGLDFLYASGRAKEAESYLKQGLKNAAAEKDDGAILAILNELMGYYRAASRYEECILCSQQALSLADAMGLSGTADYGTMLLNAARNGDQTAIETLTLDDIDTYSQVSRRLKTEDVFSIVDTYFMPYGIECDLYSIMGEILAVRRRKNIVTGVEIYQMKLNVNELQFDVCVPVEEVMGEPEIGRRFKGTIWLQGYINF